MSSLPTVRHISECFIKPKRRLEEHRSPVYLNTWDLAMLPIGSIKLGLLYPNPSEPGAAAGGSDTDKDNLLVEQLKDALSIALVPFYPLAGQLETRLLSEEDRKSSVVTFIDPSKGPGARFIHAAAADLRVSDLLSSTDTPEPDVDVDSLFPFNAVNHEGHHLPLLTIQVTQLLDGVVISCSMNHVCGDGVCYERFLNLWSEIFMMKNKLLLLLRNGEEHQVIDDDLSLLLVSSNISNTHHTRWFLDGFGPIIKLPSNYPDKLTPPLDLTSAPRTRERRFHFSSESIRKIKSRANSEVSTITTTSNNTISSYQALCALVWRCITRARRIPTEDKTSCNISTNDRRRLDPPLPDTYFGNCGHDLRATAKPGELLRQSLGWASLKLKQAISAHGDREVRDAVAAWIRSPFSISFGAKDDPPGVYDVLMVGNPRFRIYQNEFGLGKPVAVFTGPRLLDGMVIFGPGRQGGGSIDLEISLLPDYMCALETDPEFIVSASSSLDQKNPISPHSRI